METETKEIKGTPRILASQDKTENQTQPAKTKSFPSSLLKKTWINYNKMTLNV